MEGVWTTQDRIVDFDNTWDFSDYDWTNGHPSGLPFGWFDKDGKPKTLWAKRTRIHYGLGAITTYGTRYGYTPKQVTFSEDWSTNTGSAMMSAKDWTAANTNAGWHRDAEGVLWSGNWCATAIFVNNNKFILRIVQTNDAFFRYGIETTLVRSGRPPITTKTRTESFYDPHTGKMVEDIVQLDLFTTSTGNLVSECAEGASAALKLGGQETHQYEFADADTYTNTRAGLELNMQDCTVAEIQVSAEVPNSPSLLYLTKDKKWVASLTPIPFFKGPLYDLNVENRLFLRDFVPPYALGYTKLSAMVDLVGVRTINKSIKVISPREFPEQDDNGDWNVQQVANEKYESFEDMQSYNWADGLINWGGAITGLLDEFQISTIGMNALDTVAQRDFAWHMYLQGAIPFYNQVSYQLAQKQTVFGSVTPHLRFTGLLNGESLGDTGSNGAHGWLTPKGSTFCPYIFLKNRLPDQ